VLWFKFHNLVSVRGTERSRSLKPFVPHLALAPKPHYVTCTNVVGHFSGQTRGEDGKTFMKKIFFTTVIVLLSSYMSWSDIWAPPKTKDYYNADRTYFVRIVPQTVPEKFWKWYNAKPKKKKKFNASDTTIIPCYAIMFRKTSTGDSIIWKKSLINKIAPVTAYVSQDAKYLVTFDNWSAMGHGVDVMVYYDDQGNLIKRHMLEDISPFPINTYSTSISSIWWRCETTFLDKSRIEICFSDENERKEKRIYNLDERRME